MEEQQYMMPDWLTPLPPEIPPSKAAIEVQLITFESIFESMMEKLCEGIPLSTSFEIDPRPLDLGRFIRWIMRSKARKRVYDECTAVCAEILYHEIVSIADGVDNPLEEVQRSNLRIESRKYFMKIANKQRFADTKTIDLTTKDVTPDSIKGIPTEQLLEMVVNQEYDTIETTLKELPDE